MTLISLNKKNINNVTTKNNTSSKYLCNTVLYVLYLYYLL